MKYLKRLLILPILYILFIPITFEIVMFETENCEKYIERLFKWVENFGEY